MQSCGPEGGFSRPCHRGWGAGACVLGPEPGPSAAPRFREGAPHSPSWDWVACVSSKWRLMTGSFLLPLPLGSPGWGPLGARIWGGLGRAGGRCGQARWTSWQPQPLGGREASMSPELESESCRSRVQGAWCPCRSKGVHRTAGGHGGLRGSQSLTLVVPCGIGLLPGPRLSSPRGRDWTM